MLQLPDAVERILATVVPARSETVPLMQGLDRVAAEAVHSPVAVPPWRCSAMDGYAVRAADLSKDGGSLEVLEVIGAGAMPTRPVTPGTTSVVMTGAPMPEGADAVVIVEDSDGARSGRVTLSVGPSAGRYVRPRGADIEEGAVIVSRGETLGPGALGLLASVGLTEVRVARQPRVAILTTGDELVRPGKPLGPGQIWSTNHLTLATLAHRAGTVPVDHGTVGDDPEALEAALRGCLAADVVVSTGGVSVGDFDHVKDVMARLGVAMDFWKVWMKPGKPLAFGTVQVDGRTVPVFGLPGNPVSCMVGFLQFVRPWLRRSMGDPRPFLPVLDAVAGETMQARPGRARLERVALAWEDGAVVARSTGSQSSGVLTSMARGHGLLLIPPTPGDPRRGTPSGCRCSTRPSSTGPTRPTAGEPTRRLRARGRCLPSVREGQGARPGARPPHGARRGRRAVAGVRARGAGAAGAGGLGWPRGGGGGRGGRPASLWGVAVALEAAHTSRVVLAPCDLPRLRGDHVRALMQGVGEGEGVAVCGQTLQPLLAVLGAERAASARAHAAAGGSVRDWVRELPRIPLPADALHNANRPEDLGP